MSILNALRVQKANQQSVSDLAALPQNEIIRLAQMGQIPADVVPVVISEKARMAKEEANMRAAMRMQQQGRIPTVIEQAMQANAQAETPTGLPGEMQPDAMQMPAQGPMPPQGVMPQGIAPQGEEQGVAALPTGNMFQNQNFQAGGIVAFNGEDSSFVQGPTGMMIPRSEAQPKRPGQGPSSLAEFIQQYRDISGPSRVESPEEIAYREAAKKGTLSPEDIKQQQWMRMLQAGLGIMGGESPYALTNIGKGGQEALKGYAEDVKTQQAQRMLDLKTAAESARGKRMEDIKDIEGGAKLYGEYLDREMRREIAKDNQLGAKYADNYLAMMKSKGDSRPENEIRNEGYLKFFEAYGFAQGRSNQAAATAAAQQATQASIAAGSQNVQLTSIVERYANQAQDSVDKMLGNPGSAEARQYRNLAKKDPQEAAAYRQNLIIRSAKELAAAGQALSGNAPAAPSVQARPPSAAASASTKVPQQLPASRNPKDLRDGTVYQTVMGPLMWDSKSEQFKKLAK